jgi:hypothetical protein
LRTHIRELETVEIQQKENFEKQYLSKIGDLRKTVDALTRDKARYLLYIPYRTLPKFTLFSLQIDIDKAMEENDVYRL